MGNDISKGYSFSGTSPNNVVTAEKLNTGMDEATIKKTFLTSKTEVSALDSGDYILAYDVSADDYVKITAGNGIASARGIAKTNNLVMYTPNAAQVIITADAVLMRRASNGVMYTATSYSVTASIALGVALNGLDAGTEAANTHYFIHAISDGTTDRCLLSTSATSPTLPTGYIYSALLGSVKNDNSSNFVRFHQHGNAVGIELVYDASTTGDTRQVNPRTGAADFTDIAPAVAGTFQAADLARCIPANIVARVQGMLGITSLSVTRNVGVASTSTGTLAAPSITTGLQLKKLVGPTPASGGATVNGTAVAAFSDMLLFDVLVFTSQQIMWASSNTGSIHSMRLTGYTLAL